MSTDHETEVRQALRVATAELAPAPEVLARARHGGRRRQLRRRALLTGVAGVAVLAVAAAGGLLAQRPHHGPVTIPAGTPGERLLTAPTGGDLAGDGDYLRAAVRAFDDGHGNPDPAGAGQPPVVFDDLIGTPHVAWAGTTPAGRAAIVAQATDVTDRSSLGTENGPLYGVHVVLGFVGPGRDGDPTVLANEVLLTPGDDTAANTYALRLGPDRSTLLVADVGLPVWCSTRRTYDATGVHRDWTEVRFRGNAAVLTLRTGNDPALELVSATAPPGTDDRADPVLVAGTPDPGSQPDNSLRWGEPPHYRSTGEPAASLNWPLSTGSTLVHRWGNSPDPESFFDQALRNSPYYDANGFPAVGGRPWLAYASMLNGTTQVVVSEMQYGTDPSQIYAAVTTGGHTRVVYGGPADRTAALPVHVRLPGALGWVVAAKGATLSYRTATGTWQPSGTNAALLPPTATAVQVNGTTVPLA